MTVGLDFTTDWNHAAADYARHRAGFPDWFFERISAQGLLKAGDRVLALAGFEARESFWVDYAIAYSHEAWRGRIRASAAMSVNLAPEAVAAFDAEHAAMLARDFPAEPMPVPHRIVSTWGRKAA